MSAPAPASDDNPSVEVNDRPQLSELIAELSADTFDRQERASRRIYQLFTPEKFAAQPKTGEALRASLSRGNSSAACLLLLSYFPGQKTEAVLQAVIDDSGHIKTKLWNSSPVIAASLAAQVALSRLGQKAARLGLLKTIDDGDLGDLQFLLSAIREIDSPKVLHALKRNLHDDRETGSGTPAGAAPARRLCDDAVDAFVGRLSLKVGFPLQPSRPYDESQIAEVETAMNASIPR